MSNELWNNRVKAEGRIMSPNLMQSKGFWPKKASITRERKFYIKPRSATILPPFLYSWTMRILVLTFLLIGAISCQKGEKGPKGEKGSKPEKGTWTPPPDWTPPSKGSKGTKGTTTGGQGSTTEESTTSAIIVNST